MEMEVERGPPSPSRREREWMESQRWWKEREKGMEGNRRRGRYNEDGDGDRLRRRWRCRWRFRWRFRWRGRWRWIEREREI